MCMFSVDVEANGPAPGLFSMVSIGIIRIDTELETTYTSKFKPISDDYIPEAIAVSGFTYEETLEFPDPAIVVPEMIAWVKANNRHGRAVFVSDNPAFDWQWLNWYCWAYANENPFGHSARRIGDIAAGAARNLRYSARDWHKYRKTKHTHDPLMDAKGNAEAFLEICKVFNIKAGPK